MEKDCFYPKSISKIYYIIIHLMTKQPVMIMQLLLLQLLISHIVPFTRINMFVKTVVAKSLLLYWLFSTLHICTITLPYLLPEEFFFAKWLNAGLHFNLIILW